MDRSASPVLTRRLIAEDARWLRDAILGAQAVGGRTASALSLVLLGTAARVVYEGIRVLRTVELDIDVRELLQHAPQDLDSLVERARHATKLLDDTKRSAAETVSLLEEYQRAHQRAFRGSAPRALRWLTSDLGLVVSHGHVLAATVPLQLRLGLRVDADLEEAGPFLGDVARQIGSALAVLAAVDLDLAAYAAEPPPLVLPPMRLRDVDTARYLHGRFDPSATPATKLTMLMIASELQVSAHVLPHTAGESSPAVSRARIVSLIHCLRGIRTLLDGDWIRTDTQAGRRVRDVAYDPSVARFANERGLRNLRNQYVHYVFRGDAGDLDEFIPDFGVATLLTGLSRTQLDRDASRSLSELADAVAAWGDRERNSLRSRTTRRRHH